MPDSPLITLTSDFGEGSPYVAAMRGVLASRAPQARLLDISHAVPPFDLMSASFMLWVGTSTFPADTVHLAVVDPGVGTARQRMVLVTEVGTYIGPDNGLMSYVMMRLSHWQAFAIQSPDLLGPGSSATFEGRDVFAVLAAAIASGLPACRVGPELTDPVRLPDLLPRRDADGSLLGMVIWVDSFGNLVTNLTAADTMHGSSIEIASHGPLRVVRTFADVDVGQPVAYLGSSGTVEIGIREGRADRIFGITTGTPVRVGREAPPKIC